MKKQKDAIQRNICLLTALMFLCFASLLTVAGVNGLHMLIYAAAPCFFLFILFLYSAQATPQMLKQVIKNSENPRFWF